MKYVVVLIIFLVALLYAAPWITERVPSRYNPFTPLSVNDPPNVITKYKLRRLDNNPEACLAVLDSAEQEGAISFTRVASTQGKCPLQSPVRVQKFGSVSLSSSFLASCRLALSSAMFVSQVAKPQAEAQLIAGLTRIDHLGSYACRNVYHRAEGRLSEHATAEALDVAGFRLADGRNITVLKAWKQDDASGSFIRDMFNRSCPYFGNSIGPDYNAAHANHFHLGMRWFGFCR